MEYKHPVKISIEFKSLSHSNSHSKSIVSKEKNIIYYYTSLEFNKTILIKIQNLEKLIILLVYRLQEPTSMKLRLSNSGIA